MNNNVKSAILGVGVFMGGVEYHLKNPVTYLAAGAVGIGATIASKSVRQGIEAGAFAVIGMIGFTTMEAIPHVYKQAVEDGILEED